MIMDRAYEGDEIPQPALVPEHEPVTPPLRSQSSSMR